MEKKLRHGSLFSGIGGFDLAAQWMGWENVFHCEWNEFGKKVLHYYWPNAIQYDDITKSDFTIHRGRIDILTGGFPCQPYSMAGKRLGKEDERHLWPSMLRAIREIKPTWVVGENVLGIVSWNGGMVFDEVQADLEAEGYEVQPFVLPACAVNAPHRRDRVWFVAHRSDTGIKGVREREEHPDGHNPTSDPEGIENNGDGQGRLHPIITGINEQGVTPNSQETKCERSCGTRTGWDGLANPCDETPQNPVSDGRIQREPVEEGAEIRQFGNAGAGDSERVCGAEMAGVVADTYEIELQCKRGPAGVGRHFRPGFGDSQNNKPTWDNFPTQPPVRHGNDGVSSGLVRITVHGRRGRRVLTDRQAWSLIRNESIKAGGNAVVSKVVYQIFKAIQQYEDLK